MPVHPSDPNRRDTGQARLADGCQLYPVPDGSWRCALPGDRFLRLDGPEPLLRRVQAHLHGRVPDPDALAEANDLVNRLEQGGVLTAGPDRVAVGRPTHERVVHVQGTNPVAERVAELLAGQVRVTRGSAGEDSRPPLDSIGMDLLVSCADWLPDAHWQNVDEWVSRHGVGWHRVHAEGRHVIVGPCALPGRTAGYADTRARRLAAAGLADELQTHWAYLDSAGPRGDLPPVPWPAQHIVTLVAGLVVSDVLAWLTGQALPTEGDQLRIDPADGSIRRHPVLPLPDPELPAPAACPATHAEPAVLRLVDPRLGLITGVVQDTARPGTLRSCVAYTAQVSATRWFGAWSADRETSGAAFADHAAARRAAIGEAVERYCGNAVPHRLTITSFAKLSAAGRRAIDPAELALYSEQQYRTPGFPFVPLSPDVDVAWVPGRDLVDGAETLVPASLVYLNYRQAGHVAEPATNVQAFAGIAAGSTAAAATRSALEELLERDAVTLWWTSGAPAVQVEPPPGSRLAHLLADPDSAGLVVTFLRIPGSFPVPVLGAYLVDAERRVVALGTACRAAPQAAALKALTEAVASYRLSRDLLDPSCAFWRAVDAGRIDPTPYRPFRADRRYRDSFRSDWRDIHDLSLHLQIYLDPRMQDEHLTRLSAPQTSCSLAQLPTVGPDPPAAYLEMLAAQGLRPVAIDLTTRDVAACGLRVVRVVVPGLYSTAPAAFPLLGGRRLYREPVERKWLAGAPTEQSVVRAPIPFA